MPTYMEMFYEKTMWMKILRKDLFKISWDE